MKLLFVFLTFFNCGVIYCQNDTSHFIETQISQIGEKILKEDKYLKRSDSSKINIALHYYIASKINKKDSIFFNAQDTIVFKPIYVSVNSYNIIDSFPLTDFIAEFNSRSDVKMLLDKLIQSRVWMLKSTNQLKYRFKFIYIQFKN